MTPCYRMEYFTPYDMMKDRDTFVLPAYQRPYVWSEQDACAFIDTILMGLPVGAIIVRQLKWGKNKKLLIIDGQQRVSTLLGRTLGNGGHIHDVCIEADPTAADDPVKSLGSRARAVIGTGPGRIPIHMMTTEGQAWSAIPIAADGRDPTVDDEWKRDLSREQLAPFCHAEDMIRSARIPWLAFDADATDAQVVEAFRRINISGAPMSADEVEALIKGGLR